MLFSFQIAFDFAYPYLWKNGCRVILWHMTVRTETWASKGSVSPHFPEMGAVITRQCCALGLSGAAHQLAVNPPFIESLSSSESDRGKSGWRAHTR